MLSSPRNEDARFGFFAWSQSFSQMAAQIGAAAMPLIALALHVPDAQIGFVSLAQYAPVLLFTLVFGAWIDATSKLTPMLLAHAGRAGVFFTLAWLAAAGAITFPQLLIGVFIAGTFTSAFDVSVQGIIPQLVSSDRLIRANARIQLTYSIAQVVGPSAAGLLVGLGSPGMAFLIIAVTYTVAFIVLAPLRSKAVQAKSEKNNAELGVVRRLWEGMRFSFSDRVLVRLLTAGALFNLAEQALITTFLVYAGRNLGIPTTRLGMLLAAAGVGAVLAAAATRGRLQRSLTLTMLSWMSLATFAPLLLLAVQSADLTAYCCDRYGFLDLRCGPRCVQRHCRLDPATPRPGRNAEPRRCRLQVLRLRRPRTRRTHVFGAGRPLRGAKCVDDHRVRHGRDDRSLRGATLASARRHRRNLRCPLIH